MFQHILAAQESCRRFLPVLPFLTERECERQRAAHRPRWRKDAEVGLARDRSPESPPILGPRNLHRAEARQVRRQELRIEQAEAPKPQSREKVH